MARPTRVVYVENDPTLRGIVGSMLRSSREFEVVAACADSTEALAQVDPGILDVALLDLALGKQSLNGTELGVLPRQVGHAADRGLAAECGVWSVMVVDVEPSRQGRAAG